MQLYSLDLKGINTSFAQVLYEPNQMDNLII